MPVVLSGDDVSISGRLISYWPRIKEYKSLMPEHFGCMSYELKPSRRQNLHIEHFRNRNAQQVAALFQDDDNNAAFDNGAVLRSLNKLSPLPPSSTYTHY